MELIIKPVTFPEMIEFNFDELKKEITTKAAEYAAVVYTEDTIKEAKKDRAQLNKFITAIETERKRVKAESEKPYKAFAEQVAELTGIVKKAMVSIDDQIAEVEQKRKEEKYARITEIYKETGFPEFVTLDKIYNPKWLNATCSETQIKQDLNSYLEAVKNDMQAINNIPEYKFEAAEVYKETLSLSKALAKASEFVEMQKRKEEAQKREHERKQAEEFAKSMYPPVEEAQEPVEEPEGDLITFQCRLTYENALKLKEFFVVNEIEFKML